MGTTEKVRVIEATARGSEEMGNGVVGAVEEDEEERKEVVVCSDKVVGEEVV